jgi:transcriptional regulator with XRE-family HTH domain
MKYNKTVSIVRGIKGLSIQDFAKKTDLSKSFISRVEKGNRNISEETIRQISRKLNIPKKFFDLLAKESKKTDVQVAKEIGEILLKILHENP